MENAPLLLERGTRRRQSLLFLESMAWLGVRPAAADEAKLTKEDRASVKRGQSPDVPCLAPCLPMDSLLCEIINLLKFKLAEARFSATCCQCILT